MPREPMRHESYGAEKEVRRAERMVLVLRASLEPGLGTVLADECARAIATCIMGGLDPREAIVECILHRLHEPVYGWPRLSGSEAHRILRRAMALTTRSVLSPATGSLRVLLP